MPELCSAKECQGRMPHTRMGTCPDQANKFGYRRTCGAPLVSVLHEDDDPEHPRVYHDDGSLCALNGPVKKSDPPWPMLIDGAPVPAHIQH